jgi:hypothetical protein
MTGRYGKYGEIKRIERLRDSRKNLSWGNKGRYKFFKDKIRKVGIFKKKTSSSV